jgi:diguanylate cyclase (GGDEF)-like protein
MADPAHPTAPPEARPPVADPARVAAVVAGPPLLCAAVVVVAEWADPVELAVLAAGAAGSVAATLRWVVAPLLARERRARRDAVDAELALFAARAESDFRRRLERALRVSESEPATLRTGLRAVAELLPDHDVALLLNVPDEPRVGWTIRLADGALAPAAPIPGTPACAALSEGRTATSDHSGRLDACAHLHAAADEVSSVCVPLRLGERLLGSVCAQGAPGERLDPDTLSLLEWTVERIGVRAAEQRLQRGTPPPGPLDPLTGLPGRVTLQHHLRDLVRSLEPFCVAVVDLDDPATLEPRGAGDDARCLLSEVLCGTLRPDDLVCRLDDARFAAVLRQCSGTQALAALERARESLVLALAETELPPFSCSAGVVESHRATSLEELVELAADACAQAHARGGNRVVVATEDEPASS